MKYSLFATFALIASSFVHTAHANQNGIVARHSFATGALDTAGFNSPSGYIETTLGTPDGNAETVMDGTKIVTCGTYLDAGNNNHVLIGRVSSAGAIDATFGLSGVTSVNPSTYAQSVTLSCARDSQGRFVVLFRDGTARNFLVRFLNNGAVDTAGFGVGGYREINPATFQGPLQVRIASGDKPVVGGLHSLNNSFVAARYTAGGVLDTSTFNAPSGVTQSSIFGSAGMPSSLAVDSQGRVIVAGRRNVGGGRAMAMVRFTSAGAFDCSQTVPTPAFTNAFANAVVTDTTNRIYLAGGAEDAAGSTGATAVARLTAAGSLDTSFGSGMAFVYYGAGVSFANSIQIAGNG